MKSKKRFKQTAWAVFGNWKGKPTILLSTVSYKRDHAVHEMSHSNMEDTKVVKIKITLSK